MELIKHCNLVLILFRNRSRNEKQKRFSKRRNKTYRYKKA